MTEFQWVLMMGIVAVDMLVVLLYIIKLPLARRHTRCISIFWDGYHTLIDRVLLAY